MYLIFTRYKPRLVIISFAVFLCAMFGCENSAQSVGKWRTSGCANAMVWEISKDRSVLIGQMRGRYSFGDRSRVKNETPLTTFVYQMELSDDHMILREPNGSKLAFTRIR